MPESPSTETARGRNMVLANRLLAGLRSREDPQTVAALFADNAQVEVPGDNGALPWIGYRVGRDAAAAFVAGTRQYLETLSFEVEEILVSETRALILGELASRIRATDRVVETAFALVITMAGGRIARFQLIEDSYAVSRAACLS